MRHMICCGHIMYYMMMNYFSQRLRAGTVEQAYYLSCFGAGLRRELHRFATLSWRRRKPDRPLAVDCLGGVRVRVGARTRTRGGLGRGRAHAACSQSSRTFSHLGPCRARARGLTVLGATAGSAEHTRKPLPTQHSASVSQGEWGLEGPGRRERARLSQGRARTAFACSGRPRASPILTCCAQPLSPISVSPRRPALRMGAAMPPARNPSVLGTWFVPRFLPRSLLEIRGKKETVALVPVVNCAPVVERSTFSVLRFLMTLFDFLMDTLRPDNTSDNTSRPLLSRARSMGDGEGVRECEVVFQDAALIVLFKPAGWTCVCACVCVRRHASCGCTPCAHRSTRIADERAAAYRDTHARTHTRTHARTHARMHARAHTHIMGRHSSARGAGQQAEP